MGVTVVWVMSSFGEGQKDKYTLLSFYPVAGDVFLWFYKSGSSIPETAKTYHFLPDEFISAFQQQKKRPRFAWFRPFLPRDWNHVDIRSYKVSSVNSHVTTLRSQCKIPVKIDRWIDKKIDVVQATSGLINFGYKRQVQNPWWIDDCWRRLMLLILEIRVSITCAKQTLL